MDINASIVDQRVTGIAENHKDLLPAGLDDNRLISTAFVLLTVSTFLDLPLEDAAELVTDAGNDASVDALQIGAVDDGEFMVTLFQGKYKRNLEGNANFPENDVIKMIHHVGTLFDPNKDINLNQSLAPKIEEIRSLVRDGYIPTVRVILCNNGKKWTDNAQLKIDQAKLGDQVYWKHFSHNDIVNILQRKKSVNESINLVGKAIIEEYDFRRVLIGRIPVSEIFELFDRSGDLLLERNVRRYLGLHSNRVNKAIHETLAASTKRKNFYFFNNGITVICNKFRHNALQGDNYKVNIEGMQIINGGQTCKTIQHTLADIPDLKSFESVSVLLRLYELAQDDQEFVGDITYATNSQNPVDLRDLHSNDDVQKQLEIGINELGYTYKRQREDGAAGGNVITSAVVAEAVLAIWKEAPHQAKFRRKEHFGKLYDKIFNGLNAAEAVLAVLIFRFVENQRKRPSSDSPPSYLPYASHFLSMLIGKILTSLASQRLRIKTITHQNYPKILTLFENDKEILYKTSLVLLQESLQKLYGNNTVSMQQLAATFRRGDLLEYLFKDSAQIEAKDAK